jgi:hypothetical protein
MKKSISVNKKSRGRPKKKGGVDPVTAVRLPAVLSSAVDAWAEKQEDEPGRSEAIRRLVELGLNRLVNRSTGLSVTVAASDLEAALRLLEAYDNKEKAGGRFKDDDQRLPDGYYVVRIDRLRKALVDLGPKAKKS